MSDCFLQETIHICAKCTASHLLPNENCGKIQNASLIEKSCKNPLDNRDKTVYNLDISNGADKVY